MSWAEDDVFRGNGGLIFLSSVDSLAMASTFNGLGNLALAQGDMASARDNYDRALGLLAPFLGESHPHVMVVTANLARTLRQPDELERAEELLRHNRQLLERIQGKRTSDVAKSWEALGVVLVMQSKHDQALKAFDQAVEIQSELKGESSMEATAPLVKSGIVLTVVGRPDEALDRFERVRALEAARAAAGGPSDALLDAFGHSLQVLALYETGKRHEAMTGLGGLTWLLEEPTPVGRSWITAELATVQATLLLAEGRYVEAETAAKRALADRLKEQSDRPRLVARNQCLVAASLIGTDQMNKARLLLDEYGETALASGYLTPLQRHLLSEAQAAAGP
jgi:tetratricopeptide (TPR) repeat protein